MRNRLAWATAGAAVAASALVATQLDRKQLQQWLGEAGGRLETTASRSRRWLERHALDEGLVLLDRVGLQPKPSFASRLLHAAFWAGAGTAVGAGAVAVVWAIHHSHQRGEAQKRSDVRASAPSPETPPEAQPAGPEPAPQAGPN